MRQMAQMVAFVLLFTPKAAPRTQIIVLPKKFTGHLQVPISSYIWLESESFDLYVTGTNFQMSVHSGNSGFPFKANEFNYPGVGKGVRAWLGSGRLGHCGR